MSRLTSAVASLRGDRRARPVIAVAALIVVFAGALIANPFRTPAPMAGASGGPTAGQSRAGSTGSPTADGSLTPSEAASAPASPSALVPADLDGLLVDPSVAHRVPIFVSIDDASPARPQSGFNATSEVWQSPVDGYESRYLMVFQEMDATQIGPVRSARFFFAHWAAELHAVFAHYGGDRQTRTWIQQWQSLFTDVNGLRRGNPAFHRVSFRAAPHNAYTSTSALFKQAMELGGGPTISSKAHLRPFRDDSLPAQYGAVRSIHIPYSTETIGYAFDTATDSYGRFIGQRPQIDMMDNQPVTARTIVVLYMPFHTDTHIEPGHTRPILGFIGTGRAVVYSEGRAIEATWSKPTEFAPTRILRPDGHELAFVRGRIFFQIVPLGTDVKAS